MASAREWAGALLGGRQGTPGALDVAGQPTLCLVFDPEEPLPRLLHDPPRRVAGDDLVRPWERVEVPAHVVVNTLGGARLAPVLAAALRGGRTFHLVVAPGASLTTNARGALALTLTRGLQRRLARLPGLEAACERALGLRLDWPRPALGPSLELARALAARPVAALPAGPLRIVHVSGRLGPGGAERQLVQAARAAREAGHVVEVLTLTPLGGEDAVHVPALRAFGVAPRALRPLAPWEPAPPDLELGPGLGAMCERHAARELLLPLAAALRELRPHVVHGWLDEPGLLAALAGLLADAPRVVIGARNLNPSRIPRFDRPWFQGTWAALAGSPRAALSANSRAAAADYAAWAGFPAARFAVVPNGVDLEPLVPLASAEDRARERARLGLPEEGFLVGGLFRLAAMKRPGDWLAALAAAAAELPGLHAVHVGSGPLLEEARAQARRLGIDERVRFLGHRERPQEVLRVCDASLLASEAEGLPNAALESQALEVPCVLTADGGAPEAILPGETGLLAPLGDVAGLAAALVSLARDPARRAAMGRAGRAHVQARFSLAAAGAGTLTLYRGEAA